MEHITVTDIKNGYFRLTPDEGYLIKEIATGRLHSEVVTKDIKGYEAVEA